MNRLALSSIALVLFVGCAAEARTSAAPYVLVATVRQVMDAITVPASDAVWQAASEAPANAEEWLVVEHAALALAESGNLLLMEGRAVDRGAWTEEALVLVRAAERAAEAARNRNLDELSSAGDVIYESCLSCHQLYMHPQFDDP
jgi:hypothetical protein